MSELGALLGIRERIERKQAALGVIGLGYVGLPVASTFAEAGFQVIGVDLKPDRVQMINEARCPIEGDEPGMSQLIASSVASGRFRATTDYAPLSAADVVLISVETPVGADKKPKYEALTNACRSLGAVMSRPALVIVESTTAPGTIDRVVRPILEETSGYQVNDGIYLGACPERVMPGRLLLNLRTMNRVCGGSTPETAETMAMLYRHIVKADLDLADPVTAELVKTAENAYRDVQIAFANEVALICEATGADVWRVRELVNKSPGRQMHLPGAGVGGHCIPKDPWLLAHAAGDALPLRLIPAARQVNDGMPTHMVRMLQEALEEALVPMSTAQIAVLGYAYLENSDDTRNSPSQVLVHMLQEMGAEVMVHDPWVPEYQGDVLETVQGCDAVVVMVAHQEYRTLDLEAAADAMRCRILVDGRNVVDTTRAISAGFLLRIVGKSV